MIYFLLIFFIDITPLISSTQISCDVMCVQHVIHFYSLQKNFFFSIKSFFTVKKSGKNINIRFNEKLISYCIFETNKHIHRNGYLRAC